MNEILRMLGALTDEQKRDFIAYLLALKETEDRKEPVCGKNLREN